MQTKRQLKRCTRNVHPSFADFRPGLGVNFHILLTQNWLWESSLSLLSLWCILFQIKLGLCRENLNLKKHLGPKNGWSLPSTFWHRLIYVDKLQTGVFLNNCEYMYITNCCVTDRSLSQQLWIHVHDKLLYDWQEVFLNNHEYMYMTNYCVTDCMVGVFLKVLENVTCIQYMTNKRATNWSVSGSICWSPPWWGWGSRTSWWWTGHPRAWWCPSGRGSQSIL